MHRQELGCACVHVSQVSQLGSPRSRQPGAAAAAAALPAFQLLTPKARILDTTLVG